MRMDERFAFRHCQADESFARLLLAVVPDHSDVAAVANRDGNDSPLFHRGFCPLKRGLRNKRAQAILSIDAQDGIGSPYVIGIDIDADEAFLDARRQNRQALQSMGMMAAQIRFRQNVCLNRTFPLVGSKFCEDVDD